MGENNSFIRQRKRSDLIENDVIYMPGLKVAVCSVYEVLRIVYTSPAVNLRTDTDVLKDVFSLMPPRHSVSIKRDLYKLGFI